MVKRKINKEGGADGGRVMILDLMLMEVEIILQTLVLPFYLFIYLFEIMESRSVAFS